MEADIRATRSIGASGLGTDRCQRGDAIGAGKFRADINRSGQALDIAACHAVRDRRQIFEQLAAKAPEEPILTDAAARVNVRSSGHGQKRDKIKGSFAKVLWPQKFQLARHQRRLRQN